MSGLSFTINDLPITPENLREYEQFLMDEHEEMWLYEVCTCGDCQATRPRLLAAADRIAELTAENERLREALRPFAKAWSDWEHFTNPETPLHLSGLSATDVIPTTMEPYRLAFEALNQAEQEQPQ